MNKSKGSDFGENRSSSWPMTGFIQGIVLLPFLFFTDFADHPICTPDYVAERYSKLFLSLHIRGTIKFTLVHSSSKRRWKVPGFSWYVCLEESWGCCSQ